MSCADRRAMVGEGWSSLHSAPLYKAFHPETSQGLARLLELVVYLHKGPISLNNLVYIVRAIDDDIMPETKDFTTFMEKYCENIVFNCVNRTVKCRFNQR